MRFFCLLLTVLISLKGLANERPELRIDVDSEIFVTAGSPILLSDLGRAQTKNRKLLSQVEFLEVLPSMQDGETRVLTNAELGQILKNRIKNDETLNNENWSYFVPEKTRIVAKKNVFSEKRVRTQILRSLEALCDDCQFEIRELKFPFLQETQKVVSYQLDVGNLKVFGPFLISIRADYETVSKNHFVSGIIKAKRKALIAKRTMTAGEKAEINDFSSSEIELNFSNEALARATDLNGRVFNRTLTSGRPLMLSDLKKETWISRGQVIRAISGDGTFEVSIQVVAEENGSSGDLVKVKNPETQKVFSGQVIDRGVVRIQ